MRKVVIIPAYNEALAIGKVVTDALVFADLVIVANNASTDDTAQISEAAGAKVVNAPIRGYGRACMAGVDLTNDSDLLIFMDGDGADVATDIPTLIAPILNKKADFVIGSRTRGHVEKGALTIQQIWGNTLACFLMRLMWNGQFTDLGPFRAITKQAYNQLNMTAPTFGWTVEMQIRALKQKLRTAEVSVNYKRRIGISKISGTVRGVILAAIFILGTIAKEAISSPAKRQHTPPT